MDTLFVPELQVSEIVEKQIINNLCGAAPHLHMIHCVGKLKDQNLIQLKNACKKANCSLNILSSAKQSLEFYGIKREHSGVLQQISVPVVAVAGLWENTDKFEVTLSLREHLLKEGYRVSQVGSRPYCELFGFHSFPEFMFDSSIDERDKIFYFNQYLVRLVEDEMPDVLLFTVPGAIHGLNDQFPNGFGMLAFQVFRAVTVDFLTVCTFYDPTPDEFLELIEQSCKYRFGRPVNCFHMSTLFIDIMDSIERGKVIERHATKELVSAAISRIGKEKNVPLVNVCCHNGADEMYGCLLNTLMAGMPATGMQ